MGGQCEGAKAVPAPLLQLISTQSLNIPCLCPPRQTDLIRLLLHVRRARFGVETINSLVPVQSLWGRRQRAGGKGLEAGNTELNIVRGLARKYHLLLHLPLLPII